VQFDLNKYHLLCIKPLSNSNRHIECKKKIQVSGLPDGHYATYKKFKKKKKKK
jgi:hypothetical protein